MQIITMVEDITALKGYAAIVCPTNTKLKPKLLSRGLDLSIHMKAGLELSKECDKLAGCAVGSAVMTKSYNIPCRKIIHAVGPTWENGETEQVMLESCYYSVLELAQKEGLRKIAIPPISAGTKKYPIEEEAEVAIETVSQFCDSNPDAFDEIAFVFTSDSNKAEYDKVLARRGVTPLGYLAFLLEIKYYDNEKLYQLIVDMLEEKLEKTHEALKKTLMALIQSIPSDTPEGILLYITRNRQMKKLIIATSNELIAEEGYKFQIRDVLIRRTSKDNVLQMMISVNDFELTEFIDSMCSKIDTDEVEHMDLILKGIHIVNDTIPEEIKSDLLVNLVQGLQEELGEMIENAAREKIDLELKIGTIELLK